MESYGGGWEDYNTSRFSFCFFGRGRRCNGSGGGARLVF